MDGNGEEIDDDETTSNSGGLPVVSKRKYFTAYNDFRNWQNKKLFDGISEPMLIDYFTELSTARKPTSLWVYYSMLKRMIKIKLDVDISSFHQLNQFLKTKSSGYVPNSSTSFTKDQISKFIHEAPDSTWIHVKVACIFGIFGALRNEELRNLKNSGVEDRKSYSEIVVRVSHPKVETRIFTITGTYYRVVQKYMALRPATVQSDRFFLHLVGGVCVNQPIGRHKFTLFPAQIAKYLSLPDPKRFTGYSFRVTALSLVKRADLSSQKTVKIIQSHFLSSNDSSEKDCEDQANNSTVEATESIVNNPEITGLRIHCTVCDVHIGCAPANQANVCEHPSLRVTLCKSCQTFYQSRDFAVGDDGQELLCRWCGQGGEVYCCSKCPYVFCKKCILQNLSSQVISDIEVNGNWTCFSCAPEILSRLRLQHYALCDYMRKTKIKIRETTDDLKIGDLMNKDLTPCCKQNRVSRQQPNNGKRKSSCDMTSGNSSTSPEPKRVAHQSVPNTSNHSPEIVPVQSLPVQTQPPTLTSVTPPQNYQLTTALPITVPQLTANPMGGFDLHNIVVDLPSKGDAYVRLPNGKLIQIKSNTVNGNKSTRPNADTVQSKHPVQIQHSQPANRQHLNILQQSPSVLPQQHPPVIKILTSTQLQKQQTLPPVHLVNLVRQSAPILTKQPALPQQTVKVVQKSAPTLTKQPQQSVNRTSTTLKIMPTLQTPLLFKTYPKTRLGREQAQFEKEVHEAMKICRQMDEKFDALMKSNAYNGVRNISDIKDLRQYLSYLTSFAIDKLTALQQKCKDAITDDSREADDTALSNNQSTFNGTDDDVQLIEPKTECIYVDSDDEIQIKKEKNSSKEITMISIDEFEIPSPPPLNDSCVNFHYDHGNDKKLKIKPVVVLDRLDEAFEKRNPETGSTTPVSSNDDFEIDESMIKTEKTIEDD